MTRRKKHKISRRKIKSTRRSISGKIDVRSNKDLPKFIKALKNKNLSLIFVYAPWCPHCHTMMPHFNKAAKNSKNTLTPIAIKDTMLDSVNDTIKKSVNKSATPLKVDGYPSFLVLNKQGNVVTPIRPDPSKLEQIMQIPDEPSGTIEYVKNNKGLLRNLGAEVEAEVEAEPEPEAEKNYNRPKTESLDVDKSISYTKPTLNEAQEITSMQNSTPFVPVKLPRESYNKGLVGGTNGGMNGGTNGGNCDTCRMGGKRGGKRGGSLMSAMLKSSYTLAPPAVLLAAAGIMTRKNKKMRKSSKKGKKMK